MWWEFQAFLIVLPLPVRLCSLCGRLGGYSPATAWRRRSFAKTAVAEFTRDHVLSILKCSINLFLRKGIKVNAAKLVHPMRFIG